MLEAVGNWYIHNITHNPTIVGILVVLWVLMALIKIALWVLDGVK